MPTLTRLLFALALLGGLAFAAVWALANVYQPEQREIAVPVTLPGAPGAPGSP